MIRFIKKIWKWIDKETSVDEGYAISLMERTAKQYGFIVILIPYLRDHSKNLPRLVPANQNLYLFSNN